MKYLFVRPEYLVCSFTGKMGYMHYADELVKEFLVFRGFTNTLQTFETELSTDIGKGFQVDKILDLIFLEYVPKFQTEKLVGLLGFLKQYYSASIDTVFLSTLSKLEVSILRYFIIHALQLGRKEKVIEFFASNGNNLLLRSHEWVPWFAIPYLKSPNLDPQFRIYFSKEWLDAVHLSTRNFLSEMFNGTRIPALLKISTEKSTIKHLKKDIKQLNLKLSQLQALLEEKEAQICQLRSSSSTEVSTLQRSHSIYSPTGTRGKHGCETNYFPVNRLSDVRSQPTANELEIEKCDDDYVKFLPELTLAKSGHDSSSSARLFGDWDDNLGEMQQEIEFPEVKVDFQETFLGHTSPISRSRFSASGNNIASASLDGTVRIWTYDSSTPSSRNATIYCGAEIMSLDWECKSDRLLLIGTADSGIKAWNVDAKRVVCDLSTTPEFPSILDLKCSPVEPIFVSAAASRRNVDQIGLASLTVWNMKTWKAMTVLPLGEDPPAITSLCFNHNGKILAASATDGMIHMFDMAAGLQITGWPAHDAAISSVLFGHDETSIFSLGYDGKIFEWSLHNQGQVLWSRDGSRFCKQDASRICRHEMAMDANGTRLLATSGSVRSPIYQVQGHTLGLRTLPHGAAITTVDWHPTLPIYLTGSADHSVRVTSIS